MNKISINITSDEKYPDYSFERGVDINSLDINPILYWLLLLAEKIAEWKDGKLGELSDRTYVELRNRTCFGGEHFTLEEIQEMDRTAKWDDQFGEEEDRLLALEVEKELLRALGKEGMERSSIPFDDEQFSREFQAMKRMEKK